MTRMPLLSVVERISNLMMSGGEWTTAQVASELGLNYSTANAAVRALRKQGMVLMTGTVADTLGKRGPGSNASLFRHTSAVEGNVGPQPPKSALPRASAFEMMAHIVVSSKCQ